MPRHLPAHPARVGGRPTEVEAETDFGRWFAGAVPLYAPPVSLPSGSARRLGTADRETWRSTFFAVAGGALWLIVARDEWGAAGALLWIDIALGILSVAAMQFRHRWPLAVTLLTIATTAVSASAIGAWVVCQVSLSARRRWREILPTAVLSVATGQVLYALQPDQAMPWYANLIFTALATAVVVAIGMYVGARRDLVESLRDRADRAEREQELRAAAAKASERASIAREMHDVLAHRMSLVALHAGALAYRTDLSVAETRDAAGIIQANSQGALADLREILGLLRDAGGEAAARPQPTLGDLDSLLEAERASGAHITLHSDLEDRSAPPRVRGSQRLPDRGGRPDERPQARAARRRHRRTDRPTRPRPGPLRAQPGASRGPALGNRGQRLRPRGTGRASHRQPRPFLVRPDPGRGLPRSCLAAVGSMSDGSIRVVLVDDDPLVRAGLHLMLGGAPQVQIVGEAGDGAEGLEVIGRTRPDVVLMDIRMPRMDGLTATQRLFEDADPPEVIVLTTFDADEHVVRALALGARGFLLKDTSPAMIVEAIEKVAAGQPILSPSVTAQLIRTVTSRSSADGAAERAKAAAARLSGLSGRERDVAVAVGQGKSNAEIAGELFMSLATVKAHVSHIFVKMQLANRVQIAICVHEAGLA